MLAADREEDGKEFGILEQSAKLSCEVFHKCHLISIVLK